jgi:hypothetical protein
MSSISNPTVLAFFVPQQDMMFIRVSIFNAEEVGKDSEGRKNSERVWKERFFGS